MRSHYVVICFQISIFEPLGTMDEQKVDDKDKL